MNCKPLRPADVRILQAGLNAAQRELFVGWKLYTDSWVEDQYEKGKLRDHQSAASEALLALYRAVVAYNGRGRFRPFLDRCLKNAVKDFEKRERRRRQISINALPTPKGGIDSDSINASVADKTPSREDPRVIHHRPRRWRRRYYRLSSVLIEVLRNEAIEAYKLGLTEGWKSAWRGALKACDKSDGEIGKLIAAEEARLQKEAACAAGAERRAKRAAQQRARRQRRREALRQAKFSECENGASKLRGFNYD